MIRCKPKSLCSWNFVLEGDHHEASLEFHWIGEEGTIIADGARFDVRKHGVYSGHWTLELDGAIIASAQKPSVWTRRFVIENAVDSLVLRPISMIGRGFRIDRSGDMIASILPDHAFTRRATIDTFEQNWDFPTICFSFWLVVIMWRRVAATSS
jgi:hypothetical protein